MSLVDVALGATPVGGGTCSPVLLLRFTAAHRSVLVSFPAAFPADELLG